VKISNNKFSFFSSRNQYFPNIPYVASKNSRFTEPEPIINHKNFILNYESPYHIPKHSIRRVPHTFVMQKVIIDSHMRTQRP
jgi:hypothetical protein